MMKVYRIEHKNFKVGPYQILSWALGNRYFRDAICPGPFEDGLGGMREGVEYSGFRCMYDLVRWFRLRDIFRLKKQGFRVYRFKIQPEYVRFGGRQLVFQKSYAYSRTEVKLSALARHVCTAQFSLFERRRHEVERCLREAG